MGFHHTVFPFLLFIALSNPIERERNRRKRNYIQERNAFLIIEIFCALTTQYSGFNYLLAFQIPLNFCLTVLELTFFSVVRSDFHLGLRIMAMPEKHIWWFSAKCVPTTTFSLARITSFKLYSQFFLHIFGCSHFWFDQEGRLARNGWNLICGIHGWAVQIMALRTKQALFFDCESRHESMNSFKIIWINYLSEIRPLF